MKKLLSFLLALTMLVSLASVSFAAPADITDEDTADAVDVLMALGIVDGYPDGTYKPEKVVTRAEMAKLIVTNLGYESLVLTGQNSSFSDVNGHWAAGYIDISAGLGIVLGYTDGTFKPDQTVSYAEAVTMIVRALGYTDESLGGTWPTNYLTKAMDNDILDNVTLGDGATRGDIAIMLFNALTLPIGTVNEDGIFVAHSNDNLMSRVGGYQGNDAVITGEEDSTMNLLPYVGVYSEIFLNEDDEIILVRPTKSLLNGDFNSDASKFESSKTYKLSSDATDDTKYFVNGEEVSSAFALEDLEDVTVSARISGSTIKEIYAISKWEVSEAGLFTDDDEDDMDYDQELFGYDFLLDDDDEIDTTTFELVGVDELSDINEDDVVYVYASESDNIRKITVGQEVVTGKITKINSASTKFTVEGNVYGLSDAPNNDIASVSVDDEVEMKLDANGDIYTMDTVETATNYAIVLETGNGIGSGLTGSNPVIKLFLADGDVEIIDVDYDNSGVSSLFSSGKTWDANEIDSGDLIEYSIDDDEIDTITVLTTNSTTSDITSKGYYAGKVVTNSAVIFGYDGNGVDDEDSYSVIDRDDALGLDSVDSDYYLDSNKIAVMIINDYDSGDDSVFALIDGFAYTSNPDYEVTYFVDGEEVEYGTDIDPSSLVGDMKLYELEFNASGEVKEQSVVTADNSTTATDIDFDGSILELDGSFLTVDSSLVIYELDEDGNYQVTTKRELETLDQTVTIDLYDVVDDDSVYDIIVFEVQ